jgi:hypothetical protein
LCSPLEAGIGTVSRWARRWYLPSKRDAPWVGSGPKARTLCHKTDRHSDHCPQT